MATLISTQKINEHSITKYNFRVLPNNFDDEVTSSLISDESSLEKESFIAEENQNPSDDNEIDSSSMSRNSKEALIESLMKKTDEMSSNFIKLQMKLESREQEYLLDLEKTKEDSFSQGLEAGILKVTEDSKGDLLKGIEQFSISVSTLENAAKDYETALENIKSELVSAAVDISQEVINIELSQNSNDIAKKLGDSLILELQSASKIVLKVNPKDHGAISEHVGLLSHIDVVSDKAVSEGGVIAISDAGNIDSQISKRFQRVKRAALSE